MSAWQTTVTEMAKMETLVTSGMVLKVYYVGDGLYFWEVHLQGAKNGLVRRGQAPTKEVAQQQAVDYAIENRHD